MSAGAIVGEGFFAILRALTFAVSIGWEMLWALMFGFLLSGIVQAVVTKGEISRLLPDSGWRTILTASGLGMASSSCSYAAVALTRSIFRKGADFTASIAFQFASTNLVLELGVVLAVLIGWKFTLAEFIGGPIMIALLVLTLRRVMRPPLVEAARRQADRGAQGRMEGHAAMDMSLAGGSIVSRALSREGFTAISHYYLMDWSSLWGDIAIGLLISGALAAWMPHSFWQSLFLAHDPVASKIIGPLLGPLIAAISSICSVGNVPLAAVLWNGGISFGGVVAFIFADLIILPILDIYRRYYGWKVASLLAAIFYATMVVAGYAMEIIFDVSGFAPTARNAHVAFAQFSLNHTTWLNIVFLLISAVLFVRFLRTGGPEMLRMMSAPAEDHGGHQHQHHHS